MVTSLLTSGFVAKHSFPSVSAEALEREVAVTVDAPRQTHALRAVSSCPADLALASVGPGAIAIL